MLTIKGDDVKGCWHTRPLCHGGQPRNFHGVCLLAYGRKGGKVMAKEKIRIRLKAYDHRILDQSGEKNVDTAKRSGRRDCGPILLLTRSSVFTVLRSLH